MCLRILSDYILKISISKFTKDMVFKITYSLFPSPVSRHYVGPFSFTSWPKRLKGSVIGLTIEVWVSQLTTHQKAHVATPDLILSGHPGGWLPIREMAIVLDSETNPR